VAARTEEVSDPRLGPFRPCQLSKRPGGGPTLPKSKPPSPSIHPMPHPSLAHIELAPHCRGLLHSARRPRAKPRIYSDTAWQRIRCAASLVETTKHFSACRLCAPFLHEGRFMNYSPSPVSPIREKPNIWRKQFAFPVQPFAKRVSASACR